MRVILVNDFHTSTAIVNATASGRLNHRQVKSAFNRLCGMSDCSCQKVSGAVRNGRKLHFTQTPTGGDISAF
jgi:hypothetical protein